MQRRTEQREGRGTAYGKWNDSFDQNKLVLVFDVGLTLVSG